MSRSFKKNPASKNNDKFFKRLANKVLRRKVKQMDLESEKPLPIKNEQVNQWSISDWKTHDWENKYNTKRK